MSHILIARHRGLREDKKSLIYISFLKIQSALPQEQHHSIPASGSSEEKAKISIPAYLTEANKHWARLIGCRTILPAAIGNFHDEVKALQSYKG